MLRFRINLLENDSIAAHSRTPITADGATGCNLLHLVYLNIVTKRGKGRGYLERSTDCASLLPPPSRSRPPSQAWWTSLTLSPSKCAWNVPTGIRTLRITARYSPKEQLKLSHRNIQIHIKPIYSNHRYLYFNFLSLMRCAKSFFFETELKQKWMDDSPCRTSTRDAKRYTYRKPGYTSLGIPYTAVFAQAFRWNVLGIAPLESLPRLYGATTWLPTLLPVPLARGLRTNSGFRARPELLS